MAFLIFLLSDLLFIQIPLFQPRTTLITLAYLLSLSSPHDHLIDRIILNILLYLLTLSLYQLNEIDSKIRRDKHIPLFIGTQDKWLPLEIQLSVRLNKAQLSVYSNVSNRNLGPKTRSKIELIFGIYALGTTIHLRNNILINHVLYIEDSLMAKIKILRKRARIVCRWTPKCREEHTN